MNDTPEVRWRQLTLGHLSRNKFWGEDPDAQYHSVVASTVLLQDGQTNILVDPTLPVDEMERRLRRLCGLGREDIHVVFATHFHTDHRVDAECYPNARLYMSEESVREAAALKRQGGAAARAFLGGAVFAFEAAPRQLSPGVRLVPLPGHTLGLSGLLFASGGQTVLLAGDTIMNREFYWAREGYFIDASQEKTAASMNWAAHHADLIVPGHGDWFFAEDPGTGLRWRRLNLCAGSEEAAVLVQAGEEALLINPALPGHLMRQVLFDASGLEPSAVTRVLCLQNDPPHTLDLPVFKNARFYLPGRQLAASGRQEGFLLWAPTPDLPVEVAETASGAVALFSSGGKKIAVAAGPCVPQALRELGVQVGLCGGTVHLLQ